MMGSNTRIYDKFEYWTVADCACRFCVNHIKTQACSLEVCCIAEIREEATWREQAAEGRRNYYAEHNKNILTFDHNVLKFLRI